MNDTVTLKRSVSEEKINEFIDKLKLLDFFEDKVKRGYKVQIKGKEYYPILAYAPAANRELASSLVVFDNINIDVEYLFEQTEFMCVVLLRNNKKEDVFIRKGLDKYIKVMDVPSNGRLFWAETKNFFLYFFKALFKGIEVHTVELLIVILRFLYPSLSRKLWQYYANPYKRVIRKRDVHKVPNPLNMKLD